MKLHAIRFAKEDLASVLYKELTKIDSRDSIASICLIFIGGF